MNYAHTNPVRLFSLHRHLSLVLSVCDTVRQTEVFLLDVKEGLNIKKILSG